jgi:hypothetical protein
VPILDGASLEANKSIDQLMLEVTRLARAAKA